jgi:hypothetical protein
MTVREALESKVSDIMDTLGSDPSFTNSQLGTVAEVLTGLVDLACEQQPVVDVTVGGIVTADVIAALDPVLEMTLRVSTLLDAMQRQASKS